MKKFRLFILFAFLSFSLLIGKAQVYTGGSFTMLDNSGSTFIHIAPEIGVNLNDKFALGGNVSYYHINGASDFSFTPYARLTFFREGLLNLFADACVNLYWSDPELYFGAGIIPGILLKTNTAFSFFVKCGYLGYSDTPVNQSSGISLSATNLNVGFYYNF
ncbi:MAG: hypothetical protein LBU37_05640 [Tannerellaceae bacterium]|jgi:hypothetical protein|nr:hypothetical protein [Tannerellaceae bacterium]